MSEILNDNVRSASNLRISLIITAAGSGKRLGANKNKILLNIDGKSLLEHNLISWTNFKEITEILITYNKNDYAEFSKIISKFKSNKKNENLSDKKNENSINNHFPKPSIKLVEGGNERSESVLNAIKSLKNDYDFLIIHDAARPFMTNELYNKLIHATENHEAIIPYLKSEDSLYYVENDILKINCTEDSLNKFNENNYKITKIDRNNIYRVQTPQCFSKRIVGILIKKLIFPNNYYTDESSAVLEAGENLHFVQSSKDLNKITTIEDYLIAKARHEK